MRTITILAVIASVAAPAFADGTVAGIYDIKFEEMPQDCNPPPVALGRGKMTISVAKNSLRVNTDLIPQMVGIASGNKVNAKTTKVVGTTVAGLSGKYSVAGHVDDGVLSLVLVADYIRQDTNKPYCTQSWNVSGLRQDTTKKKSSR
jgi:hypothetical protein